MMHDTVGSALSLSCRRRPGVLLRQALGWLIVVVAGVAAPSAVLAQLDAYSGEVAVSNRDADEKDEAFELAMREVLLANSGDKTLLNRDDVRQGLRDATTFVEQFRYRTPEPGTLIRRDTPVTRSVLASGQATQLILVRFDPERIDALIAAEPLIEEEVATAEPVDESSALVWMVIEDGDRQMLVAGNRVMNVQRRAREIAGGGGLALTFPAGDGIDRAVVTPDSLKRLPAPAASPAAPDAAESTAAAGNTDERFASDDGSGNTAATTGPEGVAVAIDVDRLREASARYAEPVILTAHLRRNALRGWSGAWLRIAGDAVRETTFETDTLDAGLQQGIAWLSPLVDESISASTDYDYGGSGGSATEALVWIGELDSLTGYADVMNLLASLDDVSLAYPKQIGEDGMLFAVVPRTALDAVNRAIEANPALRRVAPPAPGTGGELVRNAELTVDYVGP